MDIDEIRKHIDRIDHSILYLIAERMSFAEYARESKREKTLPVRNKEREKEILNCMTKDAGYLGLNKDFVKRIYTELINESCRLQEK
jgi:chorismate mutase